MSIYDPEPGIMERVDPRSLAPFPASQSFEGLVAEHLQGGNDRDDALARAGQDAAGDGAPDLDPVWTSTVGVAEETVAANAGARDDTTANVLSDRTAGAEAQRLVSVPHLPQPDAPIEGSYIDPPKPAGIDPGDDHPVDDVGRRV